MLKYRFPIINTNETIIVLHSTIVGNKFNMNIDNWRRKLFVGIIQNLSKYKLASAQRQYMN